MSINEVFSNPFDSSTSIQMSLKKRGKYLNIIIDAEAFLNERKFSKCFEILKPLFKFYKEHEVLEIKKRIKYNFTFMKEKTPFQKKIKWKQISEMTSFDDLFMSKKIKKLRKEFISIYGFDFTKSSLHIRAAKTNKKQISNKDQHFLHLDEKKGLTTIIYLTHTNQENGAFRYVKDSEKLEYSNILKSFHEINHTFKKDKKILPEEINFDLDYYQCLDTEKRKILENNLEWIEGDPGTEVTFCGNKLLHGGGVPQAGSRSAIFISHYGLLFHRLKQLL